jgi:hypothetical protein
VAVTFLGWIMPGRVFVPVEQGGFGWGPLSLVYGIGGVLAVGLLLRLRRQVMDGAEFALYWLALLCFLVLVVLSLVKVVIGPLNLTPTFAVLGIGAGVALIVLRERRSAVSNSRSIGLGSRFFSMSSARAWSRARSSAHRSSALFSRLGRSAFPPS